MNGLIIPGYSADLPLASEDVWNAHSPYLVSLIETGIIKNITILSSPSPACFDFLESHAARIAKEE
jgi:hypothetical protein